ncbi:MAG: heavy metal-binding domain-containing protein [Syntrophaceae bacterium]
MNLDTILGHLGAVIFITVFVGLVYALALRESRKVRARRAVLEALDGELGALRQKITIVVTPEVPGKTVAKELGTVTAEGAAGAGFQSVAEKRALLGLMQRALSLGADAVVNVRHEGIGPGKAQLKIGKVILVGTAVKLAE